MDRRLPALASGYDRGGKQTEYMPKLLIADDDEQLLERVADWLRTQSFTVETASDGAAAAILMKTIVYDVIVIDWEMPGRKGPELCKDFRHNGGETPILMLTAKTAIEEKERGFLSGADDYLTKPFHPKELLLRIRSLLGRKVQSEKSIYKYDALTLDLQKSAVFLNGERIKLTLKEFALMDFLIRHPEQCFTVDVLINRIWESDKAVSDQAVRVCVSRLREKLKEYNCGASIVVEQGLGYKLAMPPADSEGNRS
jgi:DNA-binding response OmpR family regulator